jgi:protein ImuA
VAGGAASARFGPAKVSSPAFAGEVAHAVRRRGPSTAFASCSRHAHGMAYSEAPPPLEIEGRIHLPKPPKPTLSELFATHPRDAGTIGFLLAQLERGKPLLWVQERMAILEAGRIYPPGLGDFSIIHVEARDAKSALWAMEEGLRCSALGAVIGELWGDPRALDFTATRRLAVAAEKNGVNAWLVRFGATPNLSGARVRWRVASAPSLAHPFDPRAPGAAAWDAELFRARGFPPGRWAVAHDGEANSFHLVAAAGDRAMAADAGERLSA